MNRPGIAGGHLAQVIQGAYLKSLRVGNNDIPEDDTDLQELLDVAVCRRLQSLQPRTSNEQKAFLQEITNRSFRRVGTCGNT